MLINHTIFIHLFTQPTFGGVYISREWLTRFDTCVEPGMDFRLLFPCSHALYYKASLSCWCKIFEISRELAFFIGAVNEKK